MNKRLSIATVLLVIASAVTAASGTPGGSAAASGAKTHEKEQTILVLGDSISAEYGLGRGAGWVALLEQRLARQDIAARVVNASVSGETSAGGRSRLPALLDRHKPDVLVLELGANDALRGQQMAVTEANLAQMTQAAQAAGARVLLLGMQVPPNYGAAYAETFASTFRSVAKESGAALVPFLLTGVADVPDAMALFQSDRIHPNAQAQPIIEGNVWPALRKLMQ